jgi:Domain of unknown function (DUF3472)
LKRLRGINVGLISIGLLTSAGASGGGIDGVGHYDDTSWSGLDAAGGYDDIEVDIRVDVSTGVGASRNDGRNDAYYYSNYVTFANGVGAYGGLQTNGFDGKKWVGKMLIFSIWTANSGIAEPGGTETKFDGEGVGYSVRLPFSWALGTTYRFKMYLEGPAGSGGRLWGASLQDLGTGQTTRIGRILVPVGFGKIRRPITFHERDRGDTPSCSAISPSRVSFSKMTANGGDLKATSFKHGRPRALPECPGISWSQDRPGGYTSGVSVPTPSAR